MAFTQRKLGLQRPKYMGPTAAISGLGFTYAGDSGAASSAIQPGDCAPGDGTCQSMAQANVNTIAYQNSFGALLSKYAVPIAAGGGALLLLAVVAGGRRR